MNGLRGCSLRTKKFSFTHYLNEWLSNWSSVEGCVREDVEELERKGFYVHRCEIEKFFADDDTGMLRVTFHCFETEFDDG